MHRRFGAQKQRRPPRAGTRAASTNDSDRWRRYEGPLGVALLLLAARIARMRSGSEHAAIGLLETEETAKDDRQGGRAHDRAWTVRAGEPAIRRATPRACRSSFGREARQAVAPERLSCRPFVSKGENHAELARSGSPRRASMVESGLPLDAPGRSGIQAIALGFAPRKVLKQKSVARAEPGERRTNTIVRRRVLGAFEKYRRAQRSFVQSPGLPRPRRPRGGRYRRTQRGELRRASRRRRRCKGGRSRRRTEMDATCARRQTFAMLGSPLTGSGSGKGCRGVLSASRRAVPSRS